jgi:iduronate 2-sulfatase
MKNILFIITHDVGRVLGAYGNGTIKTPVLDSLAESGVRFDGHYCQWPLCGPSRANLFSGLRPPATRRFDNTPFFEKFRKTAPAGFASLPEHFRNNGYESFGAGWVYHDAVDGPSWSRGFYEPEPERASLPDWADGWLDGEFFEWKAPESRELIRLRLEEQKRGGTSREAFRTLAGRRSALGPPVERADVSDDEYYDGKVTRRLCEFIESYKESKPLFLAAGYVAPHTPFRAPAKYWDLYRREDLALPEADSPPSGSDDYMAGDSEPAQYYTTFGYSKPWRANREQSRELLHGHYATISYIDALVGRLTGSLKKVGIYDNTLIVFTADHGYHEGEHGYWGKHNLWDKSLQVPLIIRDPQGPGPSVVPLVTEHVDVYPSLCALAGLEAPGFLEGESFVPLLGGGAHPEWKNTAVSHRAPMWHDRLNRYAMADSLRTAGERYTVYRDASGAVVGEELFDYRRDPGEKENIASFTSSRPLKDRMKADLSRLLEGGRR